MTKKQKHRAKIAAWRQALQDGRVVKHANMPNALTSYPTIEMRNAAMARDPMLHVVIVTEPTAYEQERMGVHIRPGAPDVTW